MKTNYLSRLATDCRVQDIYADPVTLSQQLLPWRVGTSDDEPGSLYAVWTKETNEPGSRNNLIVADGIHDLREAVLLAAAPEMQKALSDLLSMINSYSNWGPGDKAVLIEAKAALDKSRGAGQGPY